MAQWHKINIGPAVCLSSLRCPNELSQWHRIKLGRVVPLIVAPMRPNIDGTVDGGTRSISAELSMLSVSKRVGTVLRWHKIGHWPSPVCIFALTPQTLAQGHGGTRPDIGPALSVSSPLRAQTLARWHGGTVAQDQHLPSPVCIFALTRPNVGTVARWHGTNIGQPAMCVFLLLPRPNGLAGLTGQNCPFDWILLLLQGPTLVAQRTAAQWHGGTRSDIGPALCVSPLLRRPNRRTTAQGRFP